MVILAGLHPGEAHRHLGHRDEQDLVEKGHALAAEKVGRLGASTVVLEAGELEVTVGLVLDEAIGAGADVVLDGSVTGRLDDLLRIDRRRIVRMGEAHQQGWHRLLQVDDDGVRVLRLDPLQVLPTRLCRDRPACPSA